MPLLVFSYTKADGKSRDMSAVLLGDYAERKSGFPFKSESLSPNAAAKRLDSG